MVWTTYTYHGNTINVVKSTAPSAPAIADQRLAGITAIAPPTGKSTINIESGFLLRTEQAIASPAIDQPKIMRERGRAKEVAASPGKVSPRGFSAQNAAATARV